MLDILIYLAALAAGIYCMVQGQQLCAFRGRHIQNIRSVTRGPEAAREFARRQGFVIRNMGFFIALYTPLSALWGGLWGELAGMFSLAIAMVHFFFIFTLNYRYTGDSKTRW